MTAVRALHSFKHRQTGSVLAIALIVLLLMTILGVTAMQGTTMQERMAGNQRDRNLAFQAAEAALRAGEAWLTDPTNGPTNQADANDNTLLENPGGWDGTNSSGSVTIDGVASNPVFYIGPPLQARTTIELSSSDSTFHPIYPITARATGATSTAVVILETTFRLSSGSP